MESVYQTSFDLYLESQVGHYEAAVCKASAQTWKGDLGELHSNNVLCLCD